jgi:soluble lytic murein transglycosylase
VEWQDAIKPLDENDLKLAAGLASRWGWHDRVIYTFNKSQASQNGSANLPYPIAFRATVLQNAKKHRIDPAWIYGVLRQESAFMSDARSSAGAMGLMQLMPGTAQYVSKLTKTPLNLIDELFEPEKNILLGSAYLSMLLEKNAGNAVLATASYNAGDSRTQKWLPSESMAADVWIESIPFSETRNYVGKVLGYTVIFDHLLHGKSLPLKQRMPVISPLAKR